MNRFISLIVIAAVMLASCGKKAPNHAKYIPKDANNIVCIDLKSISDKLEKDSLTVTTLLETTKSVADEKTYNEIIKKFNELKDAGIDWTDKIFVSTSSLNMWTYGSQPAVEIVATLSDSKKLEDFLKKQSGIEIKKGEDFSFTRNNNMAIGWNDKVIIFATAEKKKTYDDYISDSSANAKPRSERNSDDVQDNLKKYFSQKKSESILSVDGFNDLFKKPFDIALFNQSNLDNLSGGAMAFNFLPKLKELVNGAYSYSRINFENGKVVLESNSFLSKRMGEILQKYPDRKADLSLIQNYPSQNIDGVLVFSFNPQVIPDLIKESGLDALLNLGLMQTGMSLDDFGKIFKGDFAVVISDFNVEKKVEVVNNNYSRKEEDPKAKILVAARIGDEAAFDKLIAFAVKEHMFKQNGNMFVPVDAEGKEKASSKYIIAINNDLLTFASDSSVYVAYQSKTQNISLPEEIKNRAKDKPMIAYFDINKFLTGINENVIDSSDLEAKKIMDKAKSTFKYASFSTSNFDGKSATLNGELVLNESNKNSLAQIVRFIMYGINAGMSTYNKARESVQTDTTVRPDPVLLTK